MRTKTTYNSQRAPKEEVFYDFISKKTYIIPKDNEKLYTAYKNRYVLTAIGVILASNFFFSTTTCILIGLAVLAFAEYKYRKSFLPSLTEAKAHNIKPKGSIFEIDPSYDKNKVLIKGILYISLSILLVLNAIIEALPTALFLLSCFVAVYSVFNGVNCFMAYGKKIRG